MALMSLHAITGSLCAENLLVYKSIPPPHNQLVVFRTAFTQCHFWLVCADRF